MLDDSLTAGHLESTSDPDSAASATVGDSHENSNTRGIDREQERRLEIGERFAGFQVRGYLGHGAMGVVYEAWDPTLERRVALKLLRSPSKRAAERLLREARALARFDHPNVVRIWAADVHRGAVYIAMELVEGQSLREWLTLERSWTESLAVMLAAARGLAAAHAARVIHRDFKPENVLVGSDGQARVLDFGIARICAKHPELSSIDGQTGDGEREGDEGSDLSGSFPESVEGLTEAGTLIGTLLYMAPEQHQREQADERSDQFAFCTTLFEAIYGAHPFPATNRSDLVLAVAMGKVEFPDGARSRAPRWLERVILQGLSPNREQRFATMDHLIDALERHPRRRRARNRALSAAAVIVGAVTLGVMVPRVEQPDPCADVASEIDDALGERQRQDIAERFAAIDQPWAKEMGKRVDTELEAWAAHWVEARAQACDLRHAHREATVIDERREACLSDQLDAAAAFGTVLTEAQQRLLVNVERALIALPDPAVCLGEDPPVGHASASEHEELVAELAELEWLALTGGDNRTVTRARTLVEAIRALPKGEANQSLLGDGLVTLAEAELLEGNTATAEALLHEAIRVAERSSSDGLRARAVIDLGWLLATTPGRAHEAQPLLEDAGALLERVGSPRFESIRHRQALAEALLANGEPARAREMFETALADTGSQANGSVHMTTLLGLSRVAAAENDHAAALEHAQAALAKLEFHGPDSPLWATPLNNIGAALTKLGRYDEAREAIERSVALRRASLDAEPSPGSRRRLGESLMNLANLESLAQNTGVAADAYREILTLLPDDDLGNRSLALLNLGVDHQLAGRNAQALANYEQALRLAERALPLDSPQVVAARLGIGSMLVALGRPAEARAPLERCLADWPPRMTGSLDEAELHWSLARTLLALDGWSVRVESHAIQAAELYRQLDEAARADEIDGWMKANAE